MGWYSYAELYWTEGAIRMLGRELMAVALLEEALVGGRLLSWNCAVSQKVIGDCAQGVHKDCGNANRGGKNSS